MKKDKIIATACLIASLTLGALTTTGNITPFENEASTFGFVVSMALVSALCVMTIFSKDGRRAK